MIAVIDYDAGNIHSVEKGLAKVGADVIVTQSKKTISQAQGVVLPGVGSFATCVSNLDKYNLRDPILEFIETGKPFLGICVGYQLLFEYSEENPEYKGLAIFKGSSKKFIPPSDDARTKFKVPHIGWNQVRIEKKVCKLFKDIKDNSDFYFVHSYYPIPEDKSLISSSTDYINRFASSISYKNIFATQFHPEKSQAIGLRILKNFVEIVNSEEGASKTA